MNERLHDMAWYQILLGHQRRKIFFIIIPRVFIGHLLNSETNLYYLKFHWNKHHNKHHSSFLEKEKKSKTKLFSKTS
jgi:hypothetical protein